MAVHLVVFKGVQRGLETADVARQRRNAPAFVNLTDERQHILQFFSEACRRYYLLPTPDS